MSETEKSRLSKMQILTMGKEGENKSIENLHIPKTENERECEKVKNSYQSKN